MFETGAEEAAYDKGWAHAKPYWEDKYQEKLIKAIMDDRALEIQVRDYVIDVIESIEPEDVE